MPQLDLNRKTRWRVLVGTACFLAIDLFALCTGGQCARPAPADDSQGEPAKPSSEA